MPTGKLSSQAGHAYTDALWAAYDQNPDLALRYRREGAGGSKVTIKAKNLAALERARRECEEAGVPHALIIDRDHVLPPFFDGSPIATALGIFGSKKELRPLLKRFQVV
ncbi:hypothetical protein OCUBac02_51580 (plasmid) [Bosea sp. ANAM02]|nr:hypothetical protein OCUBac02_51580 [Bosea sp. ANAM02]